MAKRISQLPEETAVAVGDQVPLYDVSTGTTKRSTVANLLKGATDGTLIVNQAILAKHVDLSFANAAGRDAAIPSPWEGCLIYLDDTNSYQMYDGSGWFTIAGKHKVGCRAVRSSTVSVAHAVEQTISWNSEDFDSGTMHDNSTNPDRITVPEDGDYIINAFASFAVSVAASAIRLYKNGVSLGFYYVPGSVTGAGEVSAFRTERLVAGDYITMSVFQSNGSSAARNLAQSNSYLSVQKI